MKEFIKLMIQAKKMQRALILLIGCLFAPLSAQTIAEKTAEMQASDEFDSDTQALLNKVNRELKRSYQQMQEVHNEAYQKYQEGMELGEIEGYLDQIRALREVVQRLQDAWRKKAKDLDVEEQYALWHQPDVALSQLVMDYGAQDYVYLIPQELSTKRISVNSNLPIPRSAWEEILQVILAQNGIGIRQLTPLIRELYPVQETVGGVSVITTDEKQLQLTPSHARVAFLLSPEVTDSRRIFQILQSFRQKDKTLLQMVGHEILIVSDVVEIQDLLRIYSFVKLHQAGQEYRLITLSKISPEEVVNVLNAIFGHATQELLQPPKIQTPATEKGAPKELKAMGSGQRLQVVPLEKPANSLFLLGTREEIDKAVEVIQSVEASVGEVREKIVFHYDCKYSDAEELAEVLEKVYGMLLGMDGQTPSGAPDIRRPFFTPEKKLDDTYNWDRMAVSPTNVGSTSKKPKSNTPNGSNFIVDPKTGSIVMVVEAGILQRLKELIKKLDVPKRMVQIEVLLVEKAMNDTNDVGLNLLRMGSKAPSPIGNNEGLTWNDTSSGGAGRGILEFVLSRKKNSGIPAFDMAYRFLISQDDVQINASPSVTTVNQTMAKIAVVDEISINTGVTQVDTVGGTNLKDSFTRSQYGIDIEITPTIHSPEESDDDDLTQFITMETFVKFETVQPSLDNRPPVTTRHVKNEVRVRNGETLVLGGLRRKTTSDRKEAVPLIGELPGLGKLFSTNSQADRMTEMFIFLTPTIVPDPREDFQRMQLEELKKRPGDYPELVAEIVEAKMRRKRRTLDGALRMVIGRAS